MVNLLDKLDPAAEVMMRDAIGGAIRTQALHVIAKLGIADRLSLGPRSAEELAHHTHTHAPTLNRVLRYLVTSGIFVQNEDGRFALNRAAEYLQSAHPRSLRRSAIRAGENLWDVASRLTSAVETGTTPYVTLHGDSFFDRMRERGKENEFATRMSNTTAGLGAAIAQLDCIARAKRVVDVGGGQGALMLSILNAHPHLHGVVFDLPATIAQARTDIERCEWVGGDFFDSVPAADVHLLSWILHDWNDDDAKRILQSCRRAGGANATLVIVEAVLPSRAQQKTVDGITTIDPYSLDMQMLLLTGGQERTYDEYQKLMGECDFVTREVRAVASMRGVSVIVADAH